MTKATIRLIDKAEHTHSYKISAYCNKICIPVSVYTYIYTQRKTVQCGSVAMIPRFEGKDK